MAVTPDKSKTATSSKPAPRRAPAKVAEKGSKLAGGKLVGELVMRSLAAVRPNPWNPNEMTQLERESLAHGLKTDGWLISQALTIWGADETGARRDIIIDGEQRWTVGTDLKYPLAPMVFLDGLTEAQAKAMTIKLDAKRGRFNRDRLVDVVKSLGIGDVSLAGVDLGLAEDYLDKLLKSTTVSFLNDIAGGSNEPDKPTRNVTPEGYTLTFSFAREDDKNKIIAVLDKLKKDTRSEALLYLCEKLEKN